eukprot:12185.XXX_689081_689351_1 [CDS] Oithona nana genome sequencing.
MDQDPREAAIIAKDNAMGYRKAQEDARRIEDLEKQLAANEVIIQELDRKLEAIRKENERLERERGNQ